MNLFYLDSDFETSAKYHVNSHCIKIILEAAQVLSTTHNILNSQGPYKTTHKNHPICVWCRESIENYIWVYKYGLALCSEYTYRYQKRHACQDFIEWCVTHYPTLPFVDKTPHPLCMPDYCKLSDPILSYRNYYNLEKSHLFSGRLGGWKNRPVPYWIDYGNNRNSTISNE